METELLSFMTYLYIEVFSSEFVSAEVPPPQRFSSRADFIQRFFFRTPTFLNVLRNILFLIFEANIVGNYIIATTFHESRARNQQRGTCETISSVRNSKHNF